MVSRKLRRCLLALFSLGILLAAEAQAQTGSIRGEIVDENGQPIDAVEIVLLFLGNVNREFKTTSNEKGAFFRLGVPVGRYKLTFTKQGHQSLEHEIKVGMGETTRVGTVTLPSLAEGMRSNRELRELSAEVTEHFQAGVAAMDAKDYAAAFVVFEKVLELLPDSPEANLNIGIAHQHLGNTDQAVTYFRKAIELQSETVDAYLALANIYSAKQQWPEALEMLQKTVELQPEDVDSLFNLGAAAMNVGDVPTAQEAFQKALELDPTHASGHYQLGMVFVNQGKSDEAIAHLEKYLELEPEGPHAGTATGVLDFLKKN